MIFNLTPLIMLSMTLCLIFAVSPLSLGIWIIIITLMAGVTLSFFMLSWYPLLVFLIYVGGLLVMFAYFVAIQPNQQLGFFKMMMTTMISYSYLTIILYNKTFTPSFFLMSFYNISMVMMSVNFYIITLLALMLFMLLIVVTKITTMNKAPLRPFNYVFTNSKNPSCH
uniref:NADH dehydrogenase subunit 6 n=1 Tax=Eusyllis blomstrandi TaxID=199554 RepID=A0A1C9UZB3_EUSBL|nr:NADH dehydrogenase subunit 6 [Eusyllis blomstrandi]AOR87117.1 NADH dehydrogenase subunit 6 [Eusyllis blomstrandi]